MSFKSENNKILRAAIVFCRPKMAMTFVEIMIAGLLMVVVFIIGWLISSSFTGVTKVRNFETAIYLANQAIEAVRAARSRELGDDSDKGRDTLIADFHSADNMFDEKGEGFVPVIKVGGIEYNRKISIKKVPGSNDDIDSGLKLIRVRVSWQSVEDGRPLVFEAVTTHSDQW